MSKKGPLGKAEGFYVEEKYRSGNSIEDIAKELDRSINTITSYVKINNLKPKEDSIMSQQFAKTKGATVMTENASSMIDSKRKINYAFNNNCITKIKND
jgi:hypothetical protein